MLYLPPTGIHQCMCQVRFQTGLDICKFRSFGQKLRHSRPKCSMIHQYTPFTMHSRRYVRYSTTSQDCTETKTHILADSQNFMNELDSGLVQKFTESRYKQVLPPGCPLVLPSPTRGAPHPSPLPTHRCLAGFHGNLS